MTRSVKPRRIAAVGMALAVLAAPVALASGASAATVTDTVIAADSAGGPADAPASTPTPQRVVGIEASIVNGLVVTGANGTQVTLTARGERPRTLTPKGSAPAVFRQLTPGTSYTVTIGGARAGTGVPVAAVGPAHGLTVSTTGTADEVLLRWEHTPAVGQGASVSFDVVATPITTIGRTSSASPISGTTTAPVTTVALDPTVKYVFTVTPRNSASTGRATVATMTRTLAELGGATAVPTSAAPSPAPAAPSATSTAPAPAPAPGPAPGPSTRTIYVCPTGFTETAAGACEKQTPYTFTTTAYTYHQEDVYGYGQVDWAYSWGHCTGAGTSGNWANGDPYCRTAVYGDNALIGTRSVKDATPAGATDTGSAWSTKDPAPAGHTDNGTAWVQTTPKVPTVVPA